MTLLYSPFYEDYTDIQTFNYEEFHKQSLFLISCLQNPSAFVPPPAQIPVNMGRTDPTSSLDKLKFPLFMVVMDHILLDNEVDPRRQRSAITAFLWDQPGDGAGVRRGMSGSVASI